jgi:hypothetical protein
MGLRQCRFPSRKDRRTRHSCCAKPQPTLAFSGPRHEPRWADGNWSAKQTRRRSPCMEGTLLQCNSDAGTLCEAGPITVIRKSSRDDTQLWQGLVLWRSNVTGSTRLAQPVILA